MNICNGQVHQIKLSNRIYSSTYHIILGGLLVDLYAESAGIELWHRYIHVGIHGKETAMGQVNREQTRYLLLWRIFQAHNHIVLGSVLAAFFVPVKCTNLQCVINKL